MITEFNVINFDNIKDQMTEVREVDSGRCKKKRHSYLTKFWLLRNIVSKSWKMK